MTKSEAYERGLCADCNAWSAKRGRCLAEVLHPGDECPRDAEEKRRRDEKP